MKSVNINKNLMPISFSFQYFVYGLWHAEIVIKICSEEIVNVNYVNGTFN